MYLGQAQSNGVLLQVGTRVTTLMPSICIFVISRIAELHSTGEKFQSTSSTIISMVSTSGTQLFVPLIKPRCGLEISPGITRPSISGRESAAHTVRVNTADVTLSFVTSGRVAHPESKGNGSSHLFNLGTFYRHVFVGTTPSRSQSMLLILCCLLYYGSP